MAQSPNVTGNAADVSRVIAPIGANGSVNSTTALSNVFNENNPRSVYTQNGTSFYISGQGNKDATGGVFFVSNVGAATATAITGADTSSGSNGTFNQDTRGVQIVNAQLTVSVDSTEGSAKHNIDLIGTLGAAGNPPTTPLNQQPTALPGISGAVTLSSGNDNDTGTGHGVNGLFGLTGEVVGNSVELFATSSVLGDTEQTYLYGITDNLSATSAAQVTGEDFTTPAAAPADSDFKGVAFAPVPLPSSVTMLLGGLGLFGTFAVRRGNRRR